MTPASPILISACLIGQPVRYDGRAAACDTSLLAQWATAGRLIPICPELAGGLPVPRPAAEITGGAGGHAVLAGKAHVITRLGDDVSPAFVRGAQAALALAQQRGVQVAILKENSPSCGVAHSYDGHFSGTRVDEPGVTTAQLRAAGIAVFSDQQLADAAAWIAQLDAQNE
ncbi:DUF523 domain-containing protein [Chitinimonas sp. BJYL2]|uniref:DUF523 domain-containing protein n=1 Tax=Chitinimonas sp. BJYL2 TaxID=2976696 RepID=UPI0022B3E311|nr:DUF523 domain-containing protein [Chitinimonas sp. BJYL2]